MIISYLMWFKSALEDIPINNLYNERKIGSWSCHKGKSKISLRNLVKANLSIQMRKVIVKKKDEDVSEEVIPGSNFMFKELLEIDEKGKW